MMIIRHSRCCLATPWHHANIHTTSPSSARDLKKEWHKFKQKMKKKEKQWNIPQFIHNVKQTAKRWGSQTTGAGEKQKVKFEKVRFERSNSEAQGNAQYDNFTSRVLSNFPTTTEFNGYFDKMFARVPSGADLMTKLPEKYQPYLQLSRFDKPIGSWLLFLPGAWGICIAAPVFHVPSLPLLALFGTGAILMRGAGCTINDLYDIDIDRRVVRTRNRPLASGALTPQEGTRWLLIQLGLSSLILFSLNLNTILLGCSSLVLVGLYPLMKRVTDYPQLFLGLTFNYGALMGYCAYTGSLGATPFALYAAGVCWTMIYDTIYAHQDKEDDKVVGVRSTALKFGDNTIRICSNFTAGMSVALCVAGVTSGMGITYFLTTFLSCTMIIRGLSLVDLNNPKSCWEFFIMNRNIGLIILLGIILGNFM